jgi:hypothetical protein
VQITFESVATVLKRELSATIHRWMKRVNEVPALTRIPLSDHDRAGHLPELIHHLITRLRLEENAKSPETTSAHNHGKARFDQGYSVPMLVDESRLLEVSIFDTLRRHQKKVDPEKLMLDVVTIADECDVQLKHTLETFMELEKKSVPAVA